MITILLMIYAGFVLVLFKLKVIRPRPYPIAAVVVVGMFVVGGVVVVWTLCAPISPRVVTTQYVVQLVPYVKGQVVKVHAQAEQPLKKGDLLLEINPAPYQFALDQLEAELATAQAAVSESAAGLEAAKANVVRAQAGVNLARAALGQFTAGVENALAAQSKAKAADDLAKTEEQIALNLQKTDAAAISALKVVQAQQNSRASAEAVKQAAAAIDQSQAAVKQAEAGLAEAQSEQLQAEAGVRQAAFSVKVAESKVPGVQAQLDDAKFNLSQCRMTAPADGYVVNWEVQEGTMLISLRFAPAGTFIVTSPTYIIASFPQNQLMNVRAGNDVEVVLDPYPGKLFPGKVDAVIEATGEGQFTTSGAVPQAGSVGSHGLFVVKISLNADSAPPNLPLGAGGTVAVYTDRGKPVHIISKITIRLKKWLLYVIPS